MNYEGKQIQRVLDVGPDPETGDVFQLKIAGRTAETKWLSVSAAQVEAIQALLSPEEEEGPRRAAFRAGEAFSA